jgi:DNA-3-methyladenine glycosylase II
VTDDHDGAAPVAPHEHLRTTALAPLVEVYGALTVEPADDPCRRFVVSIVNQQLSSAAAATVRDRLFAALDDEVTPERLLAADESTLRDAGLSAAKTEYVRNVARAFREGRLDPDRFAGVDDRTVLDAVTEIRGVGTWTGKMFLLFGLGREDVFPVEDLGIRGGMADLFGLDRDDRTGMVERADPWRPFRSYASLYLWHHYEDGETDVGGRIDAAPDTDAGAGADTDADAGAGAGAGAGADAVPDPDSDSDSDGDADAAGD